MKSTTIAGAAEPNSSNIQSMDSQANDLEPPRREPPIRQTAADEPPVRTTVEPRGEEAAVVEPPPIVAAESIDEPPVVKNQPQEQLSFPRRAINFIGNLWEWCFGMVSLVFVLAIIATIPIVQFISLGYLLESSARVARSGRLRDGFIDITKMYRIGTVVLGTFLVTRPLYLTIDTWQAARLIDPTSSVAFNWGMATLVITLVTMLHVAWAWFRGGKARHFLWPAPVRLAKEIWRGGMFTRAADGLWDFLASLNIWHYFSLGFRGFVGALIWLLIPAGVLALGHSANNEGAGGVISVLGMFLMAFVLLYLPFLQTHMAAEDRFKAIFQWLEVRRQFRRAPLSYWLALFITLLFALPLFLLKIEVTPQEATWLASLVFVVSIFPARLLTGWAVGQARKREKPSHWVFRWTARLAAIPVVMFFALIVFLTPSLLWYGRLSLFEQHAFLVPVPFLGM